MVVLQLTILYDIFYVILNLFNLLDKYLICFFVSSSAAVVLIHIKQVFPERQGKWKATTQSREFLKSIKRYYSNAYTDGEKQDAINLYYSFHLFYLNNFLFLL